MTPDSVLLIPRRQSRTPTRIMVKMIGGFFDWRQAAFDSRPSEGDSANADLIGRCLEFPGRNSFWVPDKCSYSWYTQLL